MKKLRELIANIPDSRVEFEIVEIDDNIERALEEDKVFMFKKFFWPRDNGHNGNSSVGDERN